MQVVKSISVSDKQLLQMIAVPAFENTFLSPCNHELDT